MDLKELALKLGIALTDGFTEAVDSYCDEIVFQEKEKQRDRDISSAAQAFVSFGKSDGEIYELLLKYFDVEDISSAKEYIECARINDQAEKLREYCIEIGMSDSEAQKYGIEIIEKLESNPKLLTVAPSKLKEYIEKQ